MVDYGAENDALMMDVSAMVPVGDVTPDTLELDNRMSADARIAAKYRAAADACNLAALYVSQRCVEGASMADICSSGDEYIVKQLRKASEELDLEPGAERGIAYPVTLCVNDVVSGFAPVKSSGNEEADVLAAGSTVKIDLAVQVDGYTVSTSRTIIVPACGQQRLAERARTEGRLADCICAAYLATELVCKRLQAGTESSELVSIIDGVCAAFRVRPVDGPLVHLARRFVPVSTEKFISYDECGLTDNEFTVEPDDVYVVSMAMTSGSGRTKESAVHGPTILQRDVTQRASTLKLRAAQTAFSAITRHHSVFPFSVRPYSADATMRLGMQECLQRGLLQLVPTMRLAERNELVAHFKHTVLVQSARDGGAVRVTTHWQPPYVHSVHNLPAHLLQLHADN